MPLDPKHPITPTESSPRQRGGQTARQDDAGHREPKLPHEHDESHDSQESEPRKVIRQAYDDVQSGQEDTDLRSTRGQRVDTVPKNKP